MTDTKRFCRETSREEGGERNAWPAINYRPMVGINRILGMEDEGGKGSRVRAFIVTRGAARYTWHPSRHDQLNEQRRLNGTARSS